MCAASRKTNKQIDRVLADLGAKLSGASTQYETARAALLAADELFGWDAAFLDTYNPEDGKVEVIAAFDISDGRRTEIKDERHYLKPGTLVEKAITDGPQLLLRTPLVNPVRAGEFSFGNLDRRSESLMFVPILNNGRPTGILSVQSYENDAYSKHDIQLLQLIANFCADALERTWKASIEKSLADLGQKLAAARTTRDVADAILLAADELLGWDAAFIVVCTDEPGELESILVMDTINGSRVEGPPIFPGNRPSPDSATSRTLKEGPQLILRPVEVLPEEPAFSFGNASRASASLMFVPMKFNDVTEVGVVSIQNYSPMAYTRLDLELFQTLGNYCSGALRRTFAEKKQRLAEERFEMVSCATQDCVIDWNLITDRIWWNDNAGTVFGYTKPDNVPGAQSKWWSDRIHPEEREPVLRSLQAAIEGTAHTWNHEYRFMRRDGTYAFVHFRGFVSRNEEGRVVRMIGSMMDVTHQKQQEETLKHGAYHDSLTGLPNRMAVLEDLTRAIAHAARRKDYIFAVLFLDLDRFKSVNDSLGHTVGDELLVRVAQRLLGCIRPGDMVSRLGGDEFTVFLDDIRYSGDAVRVAERIQSSLLDSFMIAGHELAISASIGIAFSTTGYKSPTDLLRDADLAMYEAKAGGKARYVIFDPEMHLRSITSLQVESDLRRALDRNELMLYYQPIVHLHDGSLAGFEALLRWNHPVRGLVPPGEFISIAEDCGLIVPIGNWVFREACNWLARCHAASQSQRVSLSVNLSGCQFRQPNLGHHILTAIQDAQLDAAFLKIELTESTLMNHMDSINQVLRDLKARGIAFHIDDFGTGYSCLSYLDSFPIEAVKIDRSFVSRLHDERSSLTLVRAILAMATNLSLDVIAEGIETPRQLDVLQQHGCRFGQGYYYSRPLPADKALELACSTGGQLLAK